MNMYQVFIGIIFFYLLAFVFCIVYTMHSERPVAREMTGVLVALYPPLLGNAMIVLTSDESVAIAGYTLFFLGTDLLLYLVMQFIGKYCDIEVKGTLRSKVVGLVLVVDAISVLLNPLYHHVFSLDVVSLSDRTMFFALDPDWYHYIHLGISFLIAFMIFGMLLYRMSHISVLYHEKYRVMMISFAITVIWEASNSFSNRSVDTSMIGYGLSGLLFFYFSIVHQSVWLQDKMYGTVAAQISDALFFFDMKDECVYYNEAAQKMFSLKTGEYEQAGQVLEKFLPEDMDIYGQESSRAVVRVEKRDMDYVYDVESRKVYDDKGIYAGAYVQVTDRSEEERHREADLYRSTHDPLTGVYNRNELYHQTEEVLKRDKKGDYTIIVSDIKDFKMINDIFGSEVGDEVLRRICGEACEQLQEGDILGRITGDKFGMLMKTENFREEVFTEVADRVSHIENAISYPIIIQFGVYRITERHLSARIMYDRGFFAVGQIKNDLDKKVAYYDDKIRETMLWDQTILGTLDRGIAEGEIIPYLQAQVNAQTGEVEGAEALVRWNHSREGFLTPGRFMPTLEQNGIVYKMDMCIWESACRILRRWEDEGRRDMYLSVNISPKDFYFIDVYEVISGLVRKYDVDPKKLRLEITESVMINDLERKLAVIEQLRSAGFILEMDDFGSGYSSLNMLKDLPVDVLKIDMLFLSKSANVDKTRIILKLIVEMAERLHIPVISEGVETQEQVQYLKEIGCDMFQGYFFSKPISVEEFEGKYMQEVDV